MIVKRSLIAVLFLFCAFYLLGNSQVVTLKTENMDEVVDISSFVMNSKGEVFLFNGRYQSVFKFKADGFYEKTFCRRGEGPGETSRVLFMFLNPVNDSLYLPEYVSMAKGKVTVYDSEGNFKGLLQPEISREHLDRIWKLIFLKDRSYLVITQDQVGWEPAGKFFITQKEIWVRHFNQDGKLISEILKIKNIDELSHAINYGGPEILFRPDILINVSTDEKYIIQSRTDENTVTLYDKQGKKIETITLDLSRRKITDEEFEKAKVESLSQKWGKSNPRMVYLREHMIKLDYQPIYSNIFLTPASIVLLITNSTYDDGYVKTSKLVFFDWQGKKKGEKVIEGEVMGIKGDKGLIISYDDEANEHFRIEPGLLNLEASIDKNE